MLWSVGTGVRLGRIVWNMLLRCQRQGVLMNKQQNWNTEYWEKSFLQKLKKPTWLHLFDNVFELTIQLLLVILHEAREDTLQVL